MQEFFKPWRQKAGCVVLLVALAVTGMWLRSLIYTDWVGIRVGGEANIFLCSSTGAISWRMRDPHDPLPTDWCWWGSQQLIFSEILCDIENERFPELPSVPYWSIASPLVLLCIHLIFWNTQLTKVD